MKRRSSSALQSVARAADRHERKKTTKPRKPAPFSILNIRYAEVQTGTDREWVWAYLEAMALTPHNARRLVKWLEAYIAWAEGKESE
jgi:hypothetical protein